MTYTIDIRTLPDSQPVIVELIRFSKGLEYIGPHRHEYYEIFWVLEGEGSHSIDFVEYPLSPGRVYFITPGQVHEGHSMPELMYSISFNPDFVSPDYRSQLDIEQIFSQSSTNTPFVAMDSLGTSELSSLLNLTLRESESKQADMQLLSSLITSFLRYLMRYRPEEQAGHSRTDQRMVKLMAQIEEHFRHHKDTLFYSDKLALTSKRVNELTRKHFSKTVTQLVHDRIILEAKRELAYTNKTIKAIALDLGFDDVTYFSRFFRKQSTESPKAFREKMFK